MKIDFEHFVLYKGIDHQTKEMMDVRQVFANEMYDRGQGIVCHALALKIYNSQGATDYSPEEFQLMLLFAEQAMTPSFIDSLKSLAESSE